MIIPCVREKWTYFANDLIVYCYRVFNQMVEVSKNLVEFFFKLVELSKKLVEICKKLVELSEQLVELLRTIEYRKHY